MRRNLVAVMAMASALAAPAASAQYLNCTGVSCLTTTTTSIATTAGVVALIVISTNKPDRPPSHQAAQAAELYLRQNALQLAQDLALGHGPLVDELCTALQVSEEHRPAFGQLLRSDRRDLLALADLRTLDERHAVSFVEKLSELMNSDPGLKSDLQRLTASY